MGEVINLPWQSGPVFTHVVIEHGTSDGAPVHLVSLSEADDSRLFDYIGQDRDAADRAAVSLARDFGIPIREPDDGGRA